MLTFMSQSQKKPAEKIVKEGRRKTRRSFSAEEKIRMVMDGLRGDAQGEANSDEVSRIQCENTDLNILVFSNRTDSL
ncbi:MAG: hypothetical protein AMS26_24240 [Bacteroides sp. SM23_62]|nr:MAG: hypothetical protein AMS26_24240 [Bacteroides sp. SM23_62]